jgi:hypothetical protein
MTKKSRELNGEGQDWISLAVKLIFSLVLIRRQLWWIYTCLRVIPKQSHSCHQTSRGLPETFLPSSHGREKWQLRVSQLKLITWKRTWSRWQPQRSQLSSSLTIYSWESWTSPEGRSRMTWLPSQGKDSPSSQTSNPFFPAQYTSGPNKHCTPFIVLLFHFFLTRRLWGETQTALEFFQWGGWPSWCQTHAWRHQDYKHMELESPRSVCWFSTSSIPVPTHKVSIGMYAPEEAVPRPRET